MMRQRNPATTHMYKSRKRLLILDADGTTIDAFSAIEAAFSRHGLDIGDEARFQKRHNLFKYLGGLKEFPAIIKKNDIGQQLDGAGGVVDAPRKSKDTAPAARNEQ